MPHRAMPSADQRAAFVRPDLDDLAGRTGLGLRRSFARRLLDGDDARPAFIEFAPENWMGMGGLWKRVLDEAVDRFPVFCHGLSLSVGGPDPIEQRFLRDIKSFLDRVDARVYSEHLSFSRTANAHTYELLPIPFRADAVRHVARRIRHVQDVLERPLVLEIASYYTDVAAEMDEATFITRVLEEADCGLLLDVNNVYVKRIQPRLPCHGPHRSVALGPRGLSAHGRS